MNLLKFRNIILAATFASLGGCALFSSDSNKPKKNYKKSSMPKVPPKQIPGGTRDNWRYLGTTKDNQIAIEINESSISKSANNNLFQDRKTISNPTAFNFQGLTPNYKYSLSWWQLDCDQKQYNITSTSIYDSNGNLIKTYSFNATNTPSNSIDSGSIAELQYKYICQGINRNLGY